MGINMIPLGVVLLMLRSHEIAVRLVEGVGHSISVDSDIEPNEWIVMYHRGNIPPYEGLVFQSREDVIAYFDASDMRDEWEVVARTEVSSDDSPTTSTTG